MMCWLQFDWMIIKNYVPTCNWYISCHKPLELEGIIGWICEFEQNTWIYTTCSGVIS